MLGLNRDLARIPGGDNLASLFRGAGRFRRARAVGGEHQRQRQGVTPNGTALGRTAAELVKRSLSEPRAHGWRRSA